MPVSVYRYRKPEIAVTLLVGGTLLANTKYYLTAYFNKSWVYNGVFSQFADVVNFTTDSVYRSISVYWKVTVPVEGFENVGAGKIRVRSHSHCLLAGNLITIESGPHAGSYSVTTWEGYHSFIITGNFVSNYSTTLRIETSYNLMTSIVLYMNTSNPFSGDPLANTWVGNINKFSHWIWENGYVINNIAVSSEFSKTLYGTHPQIEMSVSPPPPWSAVLTKGKTWIEATGNATASEIKQALIDADVLDVSYFQGSTLFVYGIFASWGTLTLTDLTIICISGMFGGYGSQTQLTLNRCSLHLLETLYGSYMLMTANNSNFFYEGKVRYSHMSGAVYKYAVGINNSFISAQGLAAEGMTNQTVENMKVMANNSSWRIACDKPLMRYLNIEIQSGFVYLYYITNVGFINNRLVDGLTINSPTAYDISVQYNNSALIFNINNCNTSRANNRKITYTGYSFQSYQHVTDIYYWRKKTISIFSEGGIPLVGATVRLEDNSGSVYTYISDNFGKVTFEIIEQKSLKASSGNYFTELYYDNWQLIITCNGYFRYNSRTVYAYLIETTAILKQIPTPKLFTRVLNFFSKKTNNIPIEAAQVSLYGVYQSTAVDGTTQFSSNRKLVTNADLSVVEMVETSPGVWVQATDFSASVVDDMNVQVPALQNAEFNITELRNFYIYNAMGNAQPNAEFMLSFPGTADISVTTDDEGMAQLSIPITVVYDREGSANVKLFDAENNLLKELYPTAETQENLYVIRDTLPTAVINYTESQSFHLADAAGKPINGATIQIVRNSLTQNIITDAIGNGNTSHELSARFSPESASQIIVESDQGLVSIISNQQPVTVETEVISPVLEPVFVEGTLVGKASIDKAKAKVKNYTIKAITKKMSVKHYSKIITIKSIIYDENKKNGHPQL